MTRLSDDADGGTGGTPPESHDSNTRRRTAVAVFIAATFGLMAVLSLQGPLGLGRNGGLNPFLGLGRAPLLGPFERLLTPSGPSTYRSSALGSGPDAQAELALLGVGGAGTGAGGGPGPVAVGSGPTTSDHGPPMTVGPEVRRALPGDLRKAIELIAPGDRRLALRLARLHAGAGRDAVLRVLEQQAVDDRGGGSGSGSSDKGHENGDHGHQASQGDGKGNQGNGAQGNGNGKGHGDKDEHKH